MADNVRTTAIAILNEVKAKLPIGSKNKPEEFKKYTDGWTQEQLKVRWARGSQLTCCNEFVGWYSKELARRLGKPILGLGNFSTEGWLAANRKHHAWVLPRTGAKPFPGDIYRPRSFHMGVVYSCCVDGDAFYSIDAGQGGPHSGQDIIDLKNRPFDVSRFLGWIDIEALFRPAPVHPVPHWLPGWWEVTNKKRKLWYYFASDYTVTRTNLKPRNALQPALSREKVKFSIEFGNIFVFSWPKKGGHYDVEKFSPRPFAGTKVMDGDRNSFEDMSAAKL